MGTVVGLMFLCVILGVIWWAISEKLWPRIQQYVKEPFLSFLQVLAVFFLVALVLYAIAQLLSLAGIQVPYVTGPHRLF